MPSMEQSGQNLDLDNRGRGGEEAHLMSKQKIIEYLGAKDYRAARDEIIAHHKDEMAALLLPLEVLVDQRVEPVIRSGYLRAILDRNIRFTAQYVEAARNAGTISGLIHAEAELAILQIVRSRFFPHPESPNP